MARCCRTELGGLGELGGLDRVGGGVGSWGSIFSKNKNLCPSVTHREINHLSRQLRKCVLYEKHRSDSNSRSTLTFPGKHEIIPGLVRSFCL